jgi:hypothetical protein
VKGDWAWLSDHYGPAATVVDRDNSKALSDLVRKRGYQAALLSEPRAADGGGEFTMRFQYAGGFGPTLSSTGDFRVSAVERAGRWELASCRVRGTLRLR